MTDAVFTWVDGADPDHARKRARYLAEEQGDLARHATDPTRFADRGELFYGLHLVRKFAPWIERIFVVTDQQRPRWLGPRLAQRLGVSVIDHRDIFPSTGAVLPNFNSTSIESFLFRIEGLSERFLYFNDDMFLVRPTREADYFGPEPIFRGAWISDPMGPLEGLQREVLSALTLVWARSRYRDGYVGPAGPDAKWQRPTRETFWLAHAPYPLTRSLFAQLGERFDIEANARYRFRSPHQRPPVTLAANLALTRQEARSGPDDWEYLHPRKHRNAVIAARLERCRRGEVASLCVQSLDQGSESEQAMILGFLKDLIED
ncbi:Stealth CR1 domain-containing protein [Pelagibacterium lacus]|uniref:Capsular biosynthesis protein n=1 Tax=Pelagibacterium lacus TaxID=2282655 RepID=A0A369W086_9HYPH|nr:Stealth CR1 domain-containing protein [Pelagibacterium lacus]RDE08064.1 hypothetical protein DVH29_13320 [Pelagibacterium lacus]